MTAVDAVTFDSLVLPPPLPALLSILLVLGLIGLGGRAARLLPPERRGLEERAAVTILLLACLSALLHAAALSQVLRTGAVRAAAWVLAAAGLVAAWRARAAVASLLSIASRELRVATPGRRSLLLLLGLSATALLAVALGPATDADSLDYHLGVPLDWLRHGGVTDRGDWYVARLVGLGEMLNLLGLAGGTDSLGAAASVAAVILLAVVAARQGREGGEPLAGAAMVLGCPVVLFLSSTQKPALVPSASLALAVVILARRGREPCDAADLTLGAGLVAFAVSCKYTFLLSATPVAGLLVWRAAEARRTRLAFVALAAWTVGLTLPVLARNAALAGDPLWPFPTALMDGPSSPAAHFARVLREPSPAGSTLVHAAGFVLPLSPAQAASTLGLSALVGLIVLVLARRQAPAIVVAASGAVLLLAFLAQPAPRFFLDPFLWTALAAGGIAWGRGRPAVLLVLGLQLAVTGAMGLGLAARLLPGAFLGTARTGILARNASGRAVAGWLAANRASEGVLTSLRSRVFLPGMTGVDAIVHAPSTAEGYAVFERLVRERRIDALAFRVPAAAEQGSPCRGLAFRDVRTFRLGVRNPFAPPEEETWALAVVPAGERERRRAFDCFLGGS